MSSLDRGHLGAVPRARSADSRLVGRSSRFLRSHFIAVALSCLMLGLLWTAITQSRGAVQLNLSFAALPDGTQRITWVIPGSGFWDSGLRPGDVVREVPVPRVAGRAPLPVVAYEVLSGTSAPRTLLVTRSWSETQDLGLFFLSLEFFATGVLVFIRSSDRPAANRFLLLSVTCAVALAASPVTATGQPWALYTVWVFTKVAAASFVLYFLALPVARWAPFRAGFLGALFPLIALYTYTVAFDPALYNTVKPLGFAYLAIGAGVSAIHLLWPFVALWKSERERERDYLWPIAVSVGLAATMFLGGSLLPYLFTGEYFVPPSLSILGGAFVPVGFAWSVFSYRFLGVDLGNHAILKAVFEDSADQVFLVDRNGQLRDASKTARQMLADLNLSTRSVDFRALVRSWESASTRDSSNRASADDVLTGALRGRRVVDQAQAITMPDGTLRDVSVSASPIVDHRGEVDLVVLVYRDLTRRTEAQRMWADHLATISHDLRSPLATLKMQADLLAASPEARNSINLQRDLARLRSSSRYLNGLISDLIQSIRIDSGLLALRLKTVHLDDLLADVARRSAGNVENGGRVSFDVVGALPPISADPIVIERAFSNIVDNALNYTPSGTAVRIRAHREGDELRVVVSDEGPGISPSDLPRLFDRRYRGESSRGTPGTGLGLYIAREAVQLHGGRIWVESVLGEGSTFHIALPISGEDTLGLAT